MLMKKLKTYPYLVLLAGSFLIAAIAWKLGFINLKEEAVSVPFEEALSDSNSPAETAATDISEPPVPDAPAEEFIESPEKPTAPTEEFPEMPPTKSPTFFVADRSYFDDSLFIGDSRTVGLYEYGDLGNATVLADSGMSVYKIFKKPFKLASGEEKTLDEILSEKQFGKIYIMLGINELGYSFEQTVSVYKDMVETIETRQPDALIFLQANLHITGKKSAASPIYNNDNINRFNSEIQKMTDSMHRFYLDANVLFDDENGNLSTEYTVDESHVLGKYYADWVDWILTYAVTYNNEA